VGRRKIERNSEQILPNPRPPRERLSYALPNLIGRRALRTEIVLDFLDGRHVTEEEDDEKEAGAGRNPSSNRRPKGRSP